MRNAVAFLCFGLTLALVLAACTQDAYEKGEGLYSLLRADFVEAHSNSEKMIDYVTTDDDVKLQLDELVGYSWVKTADSLYRAIYYYNLLDDGRAKVVSAGRVGIPSVVLKDSLKQPVKMDPLRIESLWVGKNKRYLNASIYLKTGATDNKEAAHQLAIVADTIVKHANGKRTVWMRLYHDQGGMPEYYSQRTYFSLPLHEMKVDSLQLTIRTYDGDYQRVFPLK
jgi:hypothetical protein